MIPLLALAVNEAQRQPAAASPAPDFSLTTGDGSQVSRRENRGKWVVLYFYPKDFASGCTLEAKNFQRDLAKYEQAGAGILGVSVDTAPRLAVPKAPLHFKSLTCPDAPEKNWRHENFLIRISRCRDCTHNFAVLRANAGIIAQRAFDSERQSSDE